MEMFGLVFKDTASSAGLQVIGLTWFHLNRQQNEVRMSFRKYHKVEKGFDESVKSQSQEVWSCVPQEKQGVKHLNYNL